MLIPTPQPGRGRSLATPVGARALCGFTVIELVTALVIAGVLGTLAVPRYHSTVVNARRGEAKANLGHIASLQSVYRIEHDFSPFPDGDLSVGYVSTDPDSCANVVTPPNNKGLRNTLGFRPEGCDNLRYGYSISGGNAIAYGPSDAPGKWIYPDCAGSGGTTQCGQTQGDVVRIAANSTKADVCRDIIEFCPGGGTPCPTSCSCGCDPPGVCKSPCTCPPPTTSSSTTWILVDTSNTCPGNTTTQNGTIMTTTTTYGPPPSCPGSSSSSSTSTDQQVPGTKTCTGACEICNASNNCAEDPSLIPSCTGYTCTAPLVAITPTLTCGDTLDNATCCLTCAQQGKIECTKSDSTKVCILPCSDTLNGNCDCISPPNCNTVVTCPLDKRWDTSAAPPSCCKDCPSGKKQGSNVEQCVPKTCAAADFDPTQCTNLTPHHNNTGTYPDCCVECNTDQNCNNNDPFKKCVSNMCEDKTCTEVDAADKVCTNTSKKWDDSINSSASEANCCVACPANKKQDLTDPTQCVDKTCAEVDAADKVCPSNKKWLDSSNSPANEANCCINKTCAADFSASRCTDYTDPNYDAAKPYYNNAGTSYPTDCCVKCLGNSHCGHCNVCTNNQCAVGASPVAEGAPCEPVGTNTNCCIDDNDLTTDPTLSCYVDSNKCCPINLPTSIGQECTLISAGGCGCAAGFTCDENTLTPDDDKDGNCVPLDLCDGLSVIQVGLPCHKEDTNNDGYIDDDERCCPDTPLNDFSCNIQDAEHICCPNPLPHAIGDTTCNFACGCDSGDPNLKLRCALLDDFSQPGVCCPNPLPRAGEGCHVLCGCGSGLVCNATSKKCESADPCLHAPTVLSGTECDAIKIPVANPGNTCCKEDNNGLQCLGTGGLYQCCDPNTLVTTEGASCLDTGEGCCGAGLKCVDISGTTRQCCRINGIAENANCSNGCPCGRIQTSYGHSRVPVCESNNTCQVRRFNTPPPTFPQPKSLRCLANRLTPEMVEIINACGNPSAPDAFGSLPDEDGITTDNHITDPAIYSCDTLKKLFYPSNYWLSSERTVGGVTFRCRDALEAVFSAYNVNIGRGFTPGDPPANLNLGTYAFDDHITIENLNTGTDVTIGGSRKLDCTSDGSSCWGNMCDDGQHHQGNNLPPDNSGNAPTTTHCNPNPPQGGG